MKKEKYFITEHGADEFWFGQGYIQINDKDGSFLVGPPNSSKLINKVLRLLKKDQKERALRRKSKGV